MAMWFGSHESGVLLNSSSPPQLQLGQDHEGLQSILSSTSCYDLMRNSSKVIIFETTIPFQLAFYALLEHGTDVAPLWDVHKQSFVAMMTTQDFIHTTRKVQENENLAENFEGKLIEEVINLDIHSFGNSEFQSIDAEDSVHQLCAVLSRLETDYAPVVDPDTGNLVAILGYMDILHLLIQLGQRFPVVFDVTLEVASIGNFRNIVTAPRNTSLAAALASIDSRDLSCLPITDETGRVVGIYQPNDVPFIEKGANSDSKLENFSSIRLEDVLNKQLLTQPMSYSCICSLNEPIKVVIDRMVNSRLTQLACVDQTGVCLGVVRVKDILSFIFSGDSSI